MSGPRSCVPAGLVLLLLTLWPAAVAAQSGSDHPSLLLPRHGNSGSADALFLFDLANGSGSMIDQLRRDADSGRIKRLEDNLFTNIGRPADQPAAIGEILLQPIRSADGRVRSALFVESSTGYTVYFDDLGKGDVLGKITTLIKRPFESIAATDGNFALLMRRGGSGRTEGAYLYHAGTGKAIYMSGLDELEIDPPVTLVEGLPVLPSKVFAAPIVASEETTGYLVLDGVDGKVSLFDFGGGPGRITVRPTELVLSAELPGESLNPTPQRFVAVPLQDDDITTQGMLIVDVGTGQMGLLDGLRSPRPRLTVLPKGIYSAIRGGLRTDAARHFAVADVNGPDGDTRGAWLHDSLTGDVVFIDSPQDPVRMTLRRVQLGR